MDPAVVAAFYQGKGYTVREGARVAGLSGNEHRVPLLAEGPLGSLAIFFGDFGGVDGPEMGGARKAARDIGATPVLAADSFSNQDRQVAARLGVVLLDGSLIAGDDEPRAPTTSSWPGGLQTRPSVRNEPEPHPWPASGRVGGRDGPSTRAVDIDELLADTRRAPPAAEPEPLEAPIAADATPDSAPTPEGDALWKRPRRNAPAPAKAPRAAGSERFAWLGARSDAPAGSGTFSVDYDEVVAAREAGEAPGAKAPVPRLGDDDESLRDSIEQEERRQRRNRLQRRVFWILFAFVFLYLFVLFWNNKLF